MAVVHRGVVQESGPFLKRFKNERKLLESVHLTQEPVLGQGAFSMGATDDCPDGVTWVKGLGVAIAGCRLRGRGRMCEDRCGEWVHQAWSWGKGCHLLFHR